MAFENTKASFVAGIVVIITMLNDTIDVIFSMGAIISAVVRLICFMNINGEKELRQLNEEYRSNSGKVK